MNPATDRAKILLVDDHPANLVALEAILEPLHHETVSVLSGEEALRRLLHDDFALILLDVMMPGLDGFQTAKLIKNRPRSAATPIIFLTAVGKDEEFVFKGYEIGAIDYLVKELRAECEHFLDCILQGTPPIGGGRAAAAVVRALEAVSRSMKNGGQLT